MRILFDNLIDNATITSLHASLNYPVENLQDNVLRRRYQCSEDEDTITIIFEQTNNLITDFFYSFTNAEYLQLRLYQTYGILVYTLTINNPQSDTQSYNFTGVDAAYAELDIRGDEGVYLGGLALGEAIQFPDPKNKWNEPLADNSLFSESLGGQTNHEYIEPLREYPFDFENTPVEDKNYYIGLIKDLGIGKPVYIDPFERNHNFMMPIYAKFTRQPGPSKNGRVYDWNINIKEAR